MNNTEKEEAAKEMGNEHGCTNKLEKNNIQIPDV